MSRMSRQEDLIKSIKNGNIEISEIEEGTYKISGKTYYQKDTIKEQFLSADWDKNAQAWIVSRPNKSNWGHQFIAEIAEHLV
jgi:hypothetical protein